MEKNKKYNWIIFFWTISNALAAFILLWHGGDLFFRSFHWLLHWLKKFIDDPISVFTFLLFLYTARLWKATVDLGSDAKQTASRQAVQMQESLRIAAESANTIKDEFIASHRPWVLTTVSPDSELSWDTNGNASLALKFIMKNTGKSPALNVCPQIKFFFPKGNNNEIADVQRTIIAELHATDAVMGFTLFPGDSVPVTITYYLINKKITEYFDFLKGQGEVVSKSIPLMIVGCTGYRSSLSLDNYHVTGFNFRLMRTVTFSPQSIRLQEIEVGGDVLKEHLNLLSTIGGSGVIT